MATSSFSGVWSTPEKGEGGRGHPYRVPVNNKNTFSEGKRGRGKKGKGKRETGDSHEWRFLNKMGKPRMLISESKMHISETKDALRNRHSGQSRMALPSATPLCVGG